MPCPFTGPNFGLVQFFFAIQNFYLQFVAVINILCRTKTWFAFSKIDFCAGTKVFEEALNAVKFLGWFKKFGPAQNVLGPVKGQGISYVSKLWLYKMFQGQIEKKANNKYVLGVARPVGIFCLALRNRTSKVVLSVCRRPLKAVISSRRKCFRKLKNQK